VGSAGSKTRTSYSYATARDARATEGDDLRTGAAVITDAKRSCTRPRYCGPKSDIDAAACTRCQPSAARVGLGEIPWIGSGYANPSDAQATRAHVGQSHPFRVVPIVTEPKLTLAGESFAVIPSRESGVEVSEKPRISSLSLIKLATLSFCRLCAVERAMSGGRIVLSLVKVDRSSFASCATAI
jgi:hypothetical protein